MLSHSVFADFWLLHEAIFNTFGAAYRSVKNAMLLNVLKHSIFAIFIAGADAFTRRFRRLPAAVVWLLRRVWQFCRRG